MADPKRSKGSGEEGKEEGEICALSDRAVRTQVSMIGLERLRLAVNSPMY